MKTYIPTPGFRTIELGFFTIHLYALSILLGIVLAILITRKRFASRHGIPNEINDLALILVPVGIIGGRLYHVITTPEKYFGSGMNPIDALKIWQGGLGIWGAVALAGLVGFILFRRGTYSLSFPLFADAIAPGLLVAQGVGRLGNWFNAELFGRPTNLPWGLSVPIEFRPAGFENYQTFHPTFLYELFWCLFGALVIVALERFKPNFFRFPGARFYFYISCYCLGRFFIESLRIDNAHIILGLRLNVWVAGIVFIGSGATLIRKSYKVSAWH